MNTNNAKSNTIELAGFTFERTEGESYYDLELHTEVYTNKGVDNDDFKEALRGIKDIAYKEWGPSLLRNYSICIAVHAKPIRLTFEDPAPAWGICDGKEVLSITVNLGYAASSTIPLFVIGGIVADDPTGVADRTFSRARSVFFANELKS